MSTKSARLIEIIYHLEQANDLVRELKNRATTFGRDAYGVSDNIHASIKTLRDELHYQEKEDLEVWKSSKPAADATAKDGE